MVQLQNMYMVQITQLTGCLHNPAAMLTVVRSVWTILIWLRKVQTYCVATYLSSDGVVIIGG